jgi:hypothetical protein
LRGGRSHRLIAAVLFGIIADCNLVCADEIMIPAEVLPRDRSVDVVYRLDTPGNGDGILAIEWTDALGRLVERRKIPVRFKHTTTAAFRLDTRRAVALKNQLTAHLSFRGLTGAGAPDLRENDAQASFVAQPIERSWWDYQIIMWQKRTEEQYVALRALGITAGTVLANRGEQAADYVAKQIAPLLASNLRWYIENIATDFYSAYHRWSSDHPQNWRFLQTKEAYRANPADKTALVRDPSLSDPAWLRRIRERVFATVRSQRAYRPLYYSLGDETGVADVSAFWDFDLSSHSLRAMRRWLRQGYSSLSALNLQWNSRFTRWDDVMPMTTREAMRGADENFSAWADFKTWMDVAFARALGVGTQAVHDGDRSAYSAIEGAQIPGWGGYDYSRLARAVDAMELYDNGNNIDIAHSLNPKLAILTSHSSTGAGDIHQMWRELLIGSRGLILWDPNNAFVGEDGSRGASGERAGPYLAEVRQGLGALLINSTADQASVAILYSPASARTQWILDQKPKGDAWVERDAEAEYQDNAVRAATRIFVDLVEHTGVPHRFLSSEMVSRGDLTRGRYKVLMLPHAISLSEAEANQVRRFVELGGLVIADTEPGIFDDHSRRLTRPYLRDIFKDAAEERSEAISSVRGGGAVYFPITVGASKGDVPPCLDRRALDRMRRLLTTAGATPAFTLRSPAGDSATDVRSYVFRNGAVSILALHRDRCTAPGESNSAEQKATVDTPIRVKLAHRSFIYDVRARRPLGQTKEFDLVLGSVEPEILAVSSTPMPAVAISGPTHARLGDIVSLRFALAGPSAASLHILHVDVRDPAGKLLPHYSGNLLGPKRGSDRNLALALNERAGLWRIHATDVLTGSSAIWEIRVEE